MIDSKNTSSSDVSSFAPLARAMLKDYALVDTLRRGTDAIRAAKEAYLPKFPLESDNAYAFRVRTSVLLPVYKETIARLVGRVFAKPVTIGDNVPDKIKELCNNVDGENRNLHVFMRDAFEMALNYGLAHVLVDSAASNATTAADGKATPYMALISPANVLGWRFDGGDLVQLRVRDTIVEQDGEFGEKVTEIVTVLEPTQWRKYKQVEGEWVIFDDGKNSLGKIPLTTIYTNRTGKMTATPPLLELAHLNIKHYQSQSDQDNILHTARVPLLLRIGANDESKDIEVGSSVIDIEDGGDLRYVEHSGAAISAGRESLKDLIEEMMLVGAKLVQVNSAAKTATQAGEEASDNKSALAAMAENLRDSIDATLQFVADWLHLPDGGNVNLNSDLDSDSAPLETMNVINNMVAAGTVSPQTAFEEAKRRGILDEARTWEDEQARSQQINQPTNGAY